MRLPRYTYRIRKILYAPVTLIVLVVLFVVALRAAIGAYQNERQNHMVFEAEQREFTELSNREAFLSVEMARLQSPRGMEEELRNQFPVAKEGENMVIIVEPEVQGSTTVSSGAGGFWAAVFNFFR